jgi:thiol-disulfide isomerase/thioredoxin
MNLACRVVLVAVLAAPAFAQDGGAPATAAEQKPDAVEALRGAWAELQAAEGAVRDASKEKKRDAIAARDKASEAFLAALAAADWNALDVDADKALLAEGLPNLAEASLRKGDAKDCLRICAAMVAKYPDLAAATGRQIARAHVAAGDVEKAIAPLRGAVDQGDGETKADAAVYLGDVLAARGDLAGAAAAWKTVLDAVPADAKTRLGQARSSADLRTKLVGKPAPEIAAKTWIDGEPTALSAMKGKVVLVDFWATWCPPCRDVMPGLNALHEARKADGLVVLGVTRHYKRGFLPNPGTKDPLRDGVPVKDIAEADYRDHLKAFKTNVGITYPFVVTDGDAEAKAYHVSGIPTMAVVDRDGTIVFVKVGSGDETLLKTAVDRLLAPPPTK